LKHCKGVEGDIHQITVLVKLSGDVRVKAIAKKRGCHDESEGASIKGRTFAFLHCVPWCAVRFSAETLL
jgi:hypothetical protein